ncbi:MAG: metallopeptidase family protein [Solirubrobacterales bacterium]|nr:metallopeptidase family protein [Solirubrobacterales bacterium]
MPEQDDTRTASVEALVAHAMDRLPDWLLEVLTDVPVLVLDGGIAARAYGHYRGDGVARGRVADQIVIYRDSLLRDFGHDPRQLAAEVERTLRHEIAHHLGWAESGVAGLGL